jgi:alkanesulfonate monooxygenase SsuD/methylene tetrahydromethanopterin reductase-like flavin-dependent oxidoreductase (luciferase family)/predicted kinase
VDLPAPALVVLVGPGASGKSTWAAETFAAHDVVSSDALRALVGAGPDDVSASVDAFALLDEVVRQRVGRRLTTVIDTLGLDTARRAGWIALARMHGMPCVAVTFDTAPAVCRERNRSRARPIPADALTAQLRTWAATRDGLAEEGFDQVLPAGPLRVVPAAFAGAHAARQRQEDEPRTGLRFALHMGEFPGGSQGLRAWVRETGQAAEEAGFDAVYVMDHFRQIPQVGRPWDDFLESSTTAAFLAACTERVRLGSLVSGITYRNVAHLGKIVASLDVLSGGRAVCGLGLAWFEAEHVAYGWPFPPTAQRYALLEDALQLLPLLWGPGSPAFHGAVLDVPEAVCYPRPLQEHVPIVVGGGGERRTLRLAAQYADVANVLGDLATVRRKAAVLGEHCAAFGREVELSHLSTALVGADDRHVAELVDAHRPRGRSAASYAAAVHAGSVEDHVGRIRELADAGVAEVVLRLVDPRSMEPMSRVIARFREESGP